MKKTFSRVHLLPARMRINILNFLARETDETFQSFREKTNRNKKQTCRIKSTSNSSWEQVCECRFFPLPTRRSTNFSFPWYLMFFLIRLLNVHNPLWRCLDQDTPKTKGQVHVVCIQSRKLAYFSDTNEIWAERRQFFAKRLRICCESNLWRKDSFAKRLRAVNRF